MRARTSLVLVLLAVLPGCGVSLSVRSGCAQAAKCGQLAAGLTEDSCVSTWTAEVNRLRAIGRDTCTRLANATLALFSCRGTLTCAQSADLLASDCAQENEDWVVASSAASGECG